MKDWYHYSIHFLNLWVSWLSLFHQFFVCSLTNMWLNLFISIINRLLVLPSILATILSCKKVSFLPIIFCVLVSRHITYYRCNVYLVGVILHYIIVCSEWEMLESFCTCSLIFASVLFMDHDVLNILSRHLP